MSLIGGVNRYRPHILPMDTLDDKIAADRRKGALRVDDRVRRDFTPEEHSVFKASFLRLVDIGLNIWDAALMAEHGVRWQRGEYADNTTVEIVVTEPSALVRQARRGRPPKDPASISKFSICIDCGERLETTTAFMKDGRGGYRAECRSCFHKRYRGNPARYRYRYSYRGRKAK